MEFFHPHHCVKVQKLESKQKLHSPRWELHRIEEAVGVKCQPGTLYMKLKKNKLPFNVN